MLVDLSDCLFQKLLPKNELLFYDLTVRLRIVLSYSSNFRLRRRSLRSSQRILHMMLRLLRFMRHMMNLEHLMSRLFYVPHLIMYLRLFLRTLVH